MAPKDSTLAPKETHADDVDAASMSTLRVCLGAKKILPWRQKIRLWPQRRLTPSLGAKDSTLAPKEAHADAVDAASMSTLRVCLGAKKILPGAKRFDLAPKGTHADAVDAASMSAARKRYLMPSASQMYASEPPPLARGAWCKTRVRRTVVLDWSPGLLSGNGTVPPLPNAGGSTPCATFRPSSGLGFLSEL